MKCKALASKQLHCCQKDIAAITAQRRPAQIRYNENVVGPPIISRPVPANKNPSTEEETNMWNGQKQIVSRSAADPV